MKKVIFLGIMCLMALTIHAQGYVDLGLPSGTKWKSQNEKGFYTYDEAVSRFGKHLPTFKQWDELKTECQWSWTGSGCKVTGPNGNSITLLAVGYRYCDGSVYNEGSDGSYWSSSPSRLDDVWFIYFNPYVHFNDSPRCYGRSVRLVNN